METSDGCRTCIGGGSGGMHTTDEWYTNEKGALGVERAFSSSWPRRGWRKAAAPIRRTALPPAA